MMSTSAQYSVGYTPRYLKSTDEHSRLKSAYSVSSDCDQESRGKRGAVYGKSTLSIQLNVPPTTSVKRQSFLEMLSLPRNRNVRDGGSLADRRSEGYYFLKGMRLASEDSWGADKSKHFQYASAPRTLACKGKVIKCSGNRNLITRPWTALIAGGPNNFGKACEAGLLLAPLTVQPVHAHGDLSEISKERRFLLRKRYLNASTVEEERRIEELEAAFEALSSAQVKKLASSERSQAFDQGLILIQKLTSALEDNLRRFSADANYKTQGKSQGI